MRSLSVHLQIWREKQVNRRVIRKKKENPYSALLLPKSTHTHTQTPIGDSPHSLSQVDQISINNQLRLWKTSLPPPSSNSNVRHVTQTNTPCDTHTLGVLNYTKPRISSSGQPCNTPNVFKSSTFTFKYGCSWGEGRVWATSTVSHSQNHQGSSKKYVIKMFTLLFQAFLNYSKAVFNKNCLTQGTRHLFIAF